MFPVAPRTYFTCRPWFLLPLTFRQSPPPLFGLVSAIWVLLINWFSARKLSNALFDFYLVANHIGGKAGLV